MDILQQVKSCLELFITMVLYGTTILAGLFTVLGIVFSITMTVAYIADRVEKKK